MGEINNGASLNTHTDLIFASIGGVATVLEMFQYEQRSPSVLMECMVQKMTPLEL